MNDGYETIECVLSDKTLLLYTLRFRITNRIICRVMSETVGADIEYYCKYSYVIEEHDVYLIENAEVSSDASYLTGKSAKIDGVDIWDVDLSRFRLESGANRISILNCVGVHITAHKRAEILFEESRRHARPVA